MVKSRTINSFFKKKDVNSDVGNVNSSDNNVEPCVRNDSIASLQPPEIVQANTSSPNANVPGEIEFVHPEPEIRQTKVPGVDVDGEFDTLNLVRDPGVRKQIWEYPSKQRMNIQLAYINAKPYHYSMDKYPLDPKSNRRFQASWFALFFDWLEYSPTKDAVFCLPCFLFAKPSSRPGAGAFTVEGFRAWKKVNDGKNCAFLCHVGKDSNSIHNKAVKSCEDLIKQEGHIDKAFEEQTTEQIVGNRLRLKASIHVIRWLTFQACAFRGHDESVDSSNRGNFLELLKLLASYDKEVYSVVLEKAPQNAIYTSPRTQKEILHVFSTRIQASIRKEICDRKYCILVDESRDESKREQMAIVLRFVDERGFVRERFFDLIHVPDTTSLTLKNGIFGVLSKHNLSVKDIRGQGYDGASNMRGKWSGLQALVSSECQYAYYIHCLAHRLQLALVAASKEVFPIFHFFSKLTLVVNTVTSSTKRHDQLQEAQADEIERLLANEELDTGKGLNQIGTLKRAGDTRWSSHLGSIRSLLTMYKATCVVLRNIIKDGELLQRGEADGVYDIITSFEFLFILHLMREIMEITDDLCQALQRKSQDIVNAIHLVRTTKELIQKLRNEGWEPLLLKVNTFCVKHEVHVPDMSALYSAGRGRPRHLKDPITLEHHFRVDVFFTTIDKQLQELNNRFSDDMMELLMLSSALDPRENFRSFDIDKICKLAEKFYPDDFTDQEILHLKFQLEHFELDVRRHNTFEGLSTLPELCQELSNTGKALVYFLLDRLIRLLLTLPVSTATTERAFSAMKLVKTALRNKMEDDFLRSYLITYIEKEIARTFTDDSLVDDFADMKERRALLKMPSLGKRRRS